MKRLQLLWKLMKGNRLLYFGAVLSIGTATLFTFLSPLVIRVTIDSIIGNKPVDIPLWTGGKDFLASNLWICGGVVVLLAVLNGVFTYFKGKWSAVAAESTARNIRDMLYDHLQHVSYDYHVKAETGELIQRCTSDVETIRSFLAVQLVEIGRALFMLSTALFFMFRLSTAMSLVAMAVIPVIFGFAVGFFLRVEKVFKASDESEARLSTVLQENLTGVRVVRAFARQKYEIEKFEERNAEYRDLTYRLILLLAGYWSLSDFLCMLQIGAVLIFGVYWTTLGKISLGTLVVFVTYEGMLLWPIRQMGRILTDMGKTMVSLSRIGEILDQPTETEGETGLKPEIRGEIVFDRVSFGYDEKHPVIKDVSFTVRPGQTVAILGPTGSGKSTLMHLLPRLYDYQRGRLLIDGVNILEMDKKWLRRNVGIVLQEPFLFSKTIKENIALTMDEPDETEILEAARIAAVHDSISEFEKGYDTVVGERGVTLSGGQKQRIAIARTLIRNSPILIFDDSLSAVDTETDAAIRKALKERKHKATTFIISHRINTLAEADVILVLENGRVIQQGTHRTLVSEPGLYQRIWSIQNAIEKEAVS